MDYLKFYELSREPFQNDPDGHFFFEGSIHRRARLLLMRGVMQRKALSVLVGAAGCGKTTLAQHIFSGLDHGVFSARMLVISHAECANGWLLPHIARAYGVKQVAPDPPSQLEQIQAALVCHLENDHYPVLFVDEAQLLSNVAVMEEFRGLLNLAHGGSRILSVMLFGLPELSGILKLDKPLAQRVEVRADVSGLPPEEVAAYARHRLEKAGAQQELFTEEALGALHTYSGGVPRLINTLADNVLFEGFMSETRPADISMVASVADQLELGQKSVSGAGDAPAEDAAPTPEAPSATPQPIGESTAAELDRLALEARTETPSEHSDADFSMGSIVREFTGASESHPDAVTIVPGYDVNLPSKREEPNLQEVAPELEIFDGSTEPASAEADADEIEAIALDGLTLTEDNGAAAAARVKGEDSLALGESFSDESEVTSEESEGDRGIDFEDVDSASGEQTIVASIDALGDLEGPGDLEAALEEDDDEEALDEAFDLGDAIQADDEGALELDGVADAALELDGDVEESLPGAGESASGSEDLPEVKRAPSAAPVQDEDTFDPGELLLDDDLEEANDAAESPEDAAKTDPEEDLDELFENIQLDS